MLLFPSRYAGMLKSHKPNLVPEQDFHKKSSNDSDSKFPQVFICDTSVSNDITNH